jgi:hypothetical protein
MFPVDSQLDDLTSDGSIILSLRCDFSARVVRSGVCSFYPGSSAGQMISTTNSKAATGWSAEKFSRSFCRAVTLKQGLKSHRIADKGAIAIGAIGPDLNGVL